MKSLKSNTYPVLLLVLIVTCSGCTGLNTFGTAARAGDSIALGLGWQQELTRDDVKITIIDSMGTQFVLPPGDASVRALWQSYPDPVSNLIIGSETGQPNISGSLAGLSATLIDNSITNFDKDYSQSFMILDLPQSMALGPATINFTDPFDAPINKPTVGGGVINAINVEIVASGGTPDPFETQDDITIIDGYLKAMERAPHYTVNLQGSTTPYAVELAFTHDPDMDNGGTGRAYVSNPRGDLKNISWYDDGVNLKVVLLPSQNQSLADIKQFKFYIAGGITGLTLNPVSVIAFDINGNTVPNITASIN